MENYQMAHDVPPAVVRRLPRYYRYLQQLQSEGQTYISSTALAEALDMTASQIRQDLHWFGNFGAKKTGYPIERLIRLISHILGTKEHYKAILVGVGRLGTTLLQNFNFDDAGCDLCAAFDVNPEKSGQCLNGVPIYRMEELSEIITREAPDFAILTVPTDVAQTLADDLYSHGIRRFWNITNVELAPQDSSVIIQNLHMIDSLLMLTCEMRFKDGIEKNK